MLFNSIDFLIFFPIVISIFFIIPKKWRCIWLLISSYYFYMSWNPKYALLIAGSTVVTYLSGLFIEHANSKGKTTSMKLYVLASLIINLGILCFFKYANFFLSNLSLLFSHIGIGTIDKRFDFLLPVGISFYTFQALSYTIDVYRGQIKAERNLFKYALFVSFFPQLVAGPIERSKNLLTQIQNVENIQVWNFDRVRNGFLLMFWGLFQKLVIADRASLVVDKVITNYTNYGFIEISIAVILFAFQIYCDFGGYTNIARGAAQVMGVSLMQNFKQPYLARNIKEFWRRWHISLTSWFTDYLYIPLGGNRKGTLRKYLNILIVFGISGLWHGASWNFVAWGCIHAIYLICEDIKIIYQKNKNIYTENACFSKRLREIITTFVLADFAWIFFVCKDLTHAINVIKQMFSVIVVQSSFLNLGMDLIDWQIIFASVIILYIVDIIHEKGYSIFDIVSHQEIWFRWILYLGLIWGIIMLGIYGIAYDTSTFIYFQF